jgi:hypothetical protein
MVDGSVLLKELSNTNLSLSLFMQRLLVNGDGVFASLSDIQ